MHIGIAGGTGAGKTTVARRVTDGVDSVRVVPLDNYYRDRSDLKPAERASINYDHPDAFDWELVRGHLDALAAGEAVEMPQYDFERHVRREETVRVEPGAVVVIEGILALYDVRSATGSTSGSTSRPTPMSACSAGSGGTSRNGAGASRASSSSTSRR